MKIEESSVEEENIQKLLDDPIGRKKLAMLIMATIRASIEGTDIQRQALFLKKTNKDFSKKVTWKDMEKHFGLNKNECRRRYENICWKGHWET